MGELEQNTKWGSLISLNLNSESDDDLAGSETYLMLSSPSLSYFSNALDRFISDTTNWVKILSTDSYFYFFRFLSIAEKQILFAVAKYSN